MELFLQRKPSSEHATLGSLLVNGEHECFTLEDVVRDLHVDGSGKVFGATAISAGRYKVIIDFSQRFQKDMLHILDVPFFTGIRILSGNTDANTEGCVLVGQVVISEDYIHGGSVALPALQAKIAKAIDDDEEVWITIADAA